VQLFRSGPDADANTAAVLCRQGADLGDGEAQYLLGQMYLAGEGVPRDATEAARWLAKAAGQNVTAAYDRLGALYAEGLGLPQDFQAAADWFHRAAAQGDANALYHLGTLQLGGLGMPCDPRAAPPGPSVNLAGGILTAADAVRASRGIPIAGCKEARDPHCTLGRGRLTRSVAHELGLREGAATLVSRRRLTECGLAGATTQSGARAGERFSSRVSTPQANRPLTRWQVLRCGFT
jgi:hypothetical protein